MYYSYSLMYGHSTTTLFRHAISFIFGIHVSFCEVASGEVKMCCIHRYKFGKQHILHLEWELSTEINMLYAQTE